VFLAWLRTAAKYSTRTTTGVRQLIFRARGALAGGGYPLLRSAVHGGSASSSILLRSFSASVPLMSRGIGGCWSGLQVCDIRPLKSTHCRSLSARGKGLEQKRTGMSRFPFTATASLISFLTNRDCSLWQHQHTTNTAEVRTASSISASQSSPGLIESMSRNTGSAVTPPSSLARGLTSSSSCRLYETNTLHFALRGTMARCI